VSAYGFTLGSLTQVDADDLPRWVDRGERDLDADGLVRGRETDAALHLTARVAGRSVQLTVYKQHGRVRLEAEGADPRALERYLCDQLELTVVSQVERALPNAAPQPENGDTQQKALMEMFRALGGPKRVRGSTSDGSVGFGDGASYDL
jgi:hypothetical protein